MIRKIIGIAICFTALVTQAGAQETGIELNGGLQGTRYSLQNGENKLLPGGSFGLSYAFRLRARLDLLTGVTGGLYRTQASLPDGVVFTSYQVDDAGSAFQYSVKATGYKETQRFFAVSVPLLLHYHTTGADVQWYIDGGGKVVVPFSSSIQVSAQQLTLSGYYPDFNVAVSNLPQHGFGTVTGWGAGATTKLKPAAALSVATGVGFSLAPGTRLYAGVYVDYGLTSIQEKSDSMPLVTYSPTGVTGIKAGSVLNRSTTGQVGLLSFGLQLRLGFGSAGSKAAARSHTKKGSQQTANAAAGDQDYEAIEGPVTFGRLGETVIPENQKEHLDEVAAIMMQHPAIRISIIGHVCDGDTQPEDKKVGVERARSVAEYLRSKGIDPGRMDVSPVSETDVYEPFDPFANLRSRRAVIRVK